MLLLPLVWMALKRGERILHTAQNRAIPRETFLDLARLLNGRGDVDEIRFANGQELIRMSNGGRYTLVAPRPGVRGHSVDRILLDEVREQRSFDLLQALKPTMTASKNSQIAYLSNAGDSESLVLNDLRRRADSDPKLAYLEWSADPGRAIDDQVGWAEANPALGVTIQLDTLEDFRRSLPTHVFETEHLCRWVATTRPRIVGAATWANAESTLDGRVLRPVLAVTTSAKRAAAILAWHQSDGTIALRLEADVYGDPLDVPRLGEELKQRALRLGVTISGYDAWTDGELAKYLPNAKAIGGRDYANASATFVQTLESGRLRWAGAEIVGDDLMWAARRPHESGAWMAVPIDEEHSAVALFAAIRATWLASGPLPGVPRVL